MSVKRTLSRFPAPDQRDAEARAWDVVRAAFAEREPAVRRRPHRGSLAGLVVVLAAAGSLVLSPAGATVGRLISRALGVGGASRALISLPAPGRLLVSGAGGTWTVSSAGGKRWVGTWTDASWSPHGRYLAVARRDELAAVSPSGAAQWALQRPAVSDPRWFPLSGYRMAYLSGSELRVVVGDGSGDHLLASGVRRVAPAWRPGHAYQLAYVSGGGRVMVRDGDTGALRWSVGLRSRIRQLGWSADGSRLLVLSGSSARVYSGGGRLLFLRRDDFIRSAAISPDGRSVSMVTGGSGGAVFVVRLPAGRVGSIRRVLSGAGLGQVTFSPNGRWLLITWPAANQWVFIRIAGTPRIAAVSRISEHFSLGRSRAFPRLDGWCCSASGAVA